MKQRVAVISLGCSKNLVDSERLLSMLEAAGFEAVHEPEKTLEGDIVVVNTCGFIGDAKEESISTILGFADARQRGTVKELHVMGCLSERYRDILPTEIPEVDGWWGKYDWVSLAARLKQRSAFSVQRSAFSIQLSETAETGNLKAETSIPESGKLKTETCLTESGKLKAESYTRTLTTPSHHAYMKIAEGCNRFCAFCAIPLITGRFHSRTVESLVEEARELVSKGVKEINVIAQDLSDYGTDLPGGKSRLAELVDALAEVEGVERLRLHYAYPTRFPMDVLDAMARHPNVCRYLDIALQHASDRMLERMRRHITLSETEALLAEIRRRVPGIHLRTTLMVGFPGETEDDFEELLDFVRRQRFERMGAFAYCEEEDTFAAKHYTDDVPEDVKQRRLDTLMTLQEEISLDIQQQKVGLTLPVIVDREEPDYYIGRTEWDSPEVDPEVLIKKTRQLQPGDIVDVKITEALPFDLIGEPAEN